MSDWALETFKAYDIRGIAGSQLTPAFAERLGKAIPTFLGCKALAIGRDIRESGPDLHAAFVDGLISAGCDVHDLGICTTGALYSATANLEVDGGVMILPAIILLNITDSRCAGVPQRWLEMRFRNFEWSSRLENFKWARVAISMLEISYPLT